MILDTGISLSDDIDFTVDFCETGSTLTVVSKSGHKLVRLAALPPAKLELLKRRLEEEIAKGPRLNPFNSERRKPTPPKPVEMPLHPEGM